MSERASEASSAEQANSFAVRVNERMEERIAQYSMHRAMVLCIGSNVTMLKWCYESFKIQHGRICLNSRWQENMVLAIKQFNRK